METIIDVHEGPKSGMTPKNKYISTIKPTFNSIYT